MDQGQELLPEVVAELHQTTDLALWGTKKIAAAIGRSMATMVVMEMHPWLNLSGIKEKEKAFFLDSLILPSGLFGTSGKVVGRLIESRAVSCLQEVYPMNV